MFHLIFISCLLQWLKHLTDESHSIWYFIPQCTLCTRTCDWRIYKYICTYRHSHICVHITAKFALVSCICWYFYFFFLCLLSLSPLPLSLLLTNIFLQFFILLCVFFSFLCTFQGFFDTLIRIICLHFVIINNINKQRKCVEWFLCVVSSTG